MMPLKDIYYYYYYFFFFVTVVSSMDFTKFRPRPIRHICTKSSKTIFFVLGLAGINRCHYQHELWSLGEIIMGFNDYVTLKN